MAAYPLTHHDILKLAEPFTRHGIHVDLGASNRLERRLVFKSAERSTGWPGSPPLCETLELQQAPAGAYLLTRKLQLTSVALGALEARLVAEGASPAGLLARIAVIDPASQFRRGSGFVIAKSYRLPANEGAPHILTGFSGIAGELPVTFTAPTGRANPDGRIELGPAAGPVAELPDDLLAVLGGEWGLLQRRATGWQSRLRLRRSEPRRSREAEAKLEAMAAHLARTLSEPPGRFHDRFALARWRVALRRATPLLVSLVLIAGAFASSSLSLAEDSHWRMLVLNLPPVMLVLVFCMRELPKIEIPPLPRRAAVADWRAPGGPLPKPQTETR